MEAKVNFLWFDKCHTTSEPVTSFIHCVIFLSVGVSLLAKSISRNGQGICKERSNSEFKEMHQMKVSLFNYTGWPSPRDHNFASDVKKVEPGNKNACDCIEEKL